MLLMSLGPLVSLFFLCSFYFHFTNSFLATKIYYGEEQRRGTTMRGGGQGNDEGNLASSTCPHCCEQLLAGWTGGATMTR
jgi:hypothetical protein